MSSALPYRLTDTAEADLAEIWAYLATEASEAIARRMLAALEDCFRMLQGFPFSGTARPMLGSELRVTFHANYAIYYLVTPDELVIVRVLHGARDATAIAEQGGFTE